MKAKTSKVLSLKGMRCESANTRSPSNKCTPWPNIKGEISPPLASMPISCHQRVNLVVPHPNSSKVFTLSSFLRSEEHTSELQSRPHLVCRLLLEKKNNNNNKT